MAARVGVGKIEVGVDFDPTLVAQTIGEDSRLLGVEACWPKVNYGEVSPSSTCRGRAEPRRAEPDASNEMGCDRRLCEPRPFP